MKIYSLKTKYAYHLILWFILICFKIIIDYSIFKRIDILNNLRFFSTSFVIFYVNYIYFIPILLKQKKEVIIGVLFLFSLFLIGSFIFNPPPPHPPHRDFKEFPKPKDFLFHPMIFFKIVNFSLGFSTILFFIDKWNESEKRIKNLEFERQASQLKLIREQINPHFFFNALNSIYALSISKSEETPRVILLLADIMRYILDSQKNIVNSLEAEISNIKKYIEIQSIRFKKFNNFFCDYEGDFNKFQIEQLLLLTFVENAFKYANVKKGPIVLKVKMQDNLLDFYVSNYYEKYNKEEESHKIGLKNAKMKLDLLYPKKYELNISDENNQYIVHLKLNLKAYELHDSR